MKDFYTKLFPFLFPFQNEEHGTRNVATFHVPGFYDCTIGCILIGFSTKSSGEICYEMHIWGPKECSSSSSKVDWEKSSICHLERGLFNSC